MLNELIAEAKRLGFARVAVVPPDREAVNRAHPDAYRLLEDPREQLPGAKALLLLAYPYRPYRNAPGQIVLDAYYPASNRAHQAAQEMRDWIRSKGFAADSRALLRLKPRARRAGLGSPGRNSLIAVDGMGSWVSLQMILTDAPLPLTGADPAPALSPQCMHCDACVRACPTGALDGSGAVDLTRCLRAQPEDRPFPEPLRRALGARLLGCNACQACCPRNRDVPPREVPPELSEALSLPALLSDGHKALASFVGSNYARRMRVNARAAILAANLGRRDLTEALEALSQSDFAPAREHARWALEQLK